MLLQTRRWKLRQLPSFLVKEHLSHWHAVRYPILTGGSRLSYLAADGHGSYVIAPGAGGPAAPRVPAESVEPSAALLRLALAREPAYRVDVTWPSHLVPEKHLRATVRITRTPSDRIVASRSFVEVTVDELIEAAGCFCITFLRNQPRILRHTPRWERWSQDITGYRAYRRGLEHQRRAESASSADEYETALAYFDEAARIEPANMLVQLHRAALLELANDHRAAVAIYKKCRTLWPEHIETAYRLGNAHKSIQDHVTLAELQEPLRDITEQLKVRSLLRAWLRSCAPSRWNPGERRYWGSWLTVSLPGGISKRSTYRHAVAISELLAKLSDLLNELYSGPWKLGDREVAANGTAVPLADEQQAQSKQADGGRRAGELMACLASEMLYPGGPSATMSLLCPVPTAAAHTDEASGNQLPSISDLSNIPPLDGRSHHRRNVGWLALFNAACFLSLAIMLPAECVPDDFKGGEGWGDCCAQAAIRELGILFRNPKHALDPDWLRTDPDLAPLRRNPIGKEWAGFVGLMEPPLGPLLAEADSIDRAQFTQPVWLVNPER